MQRILMLPGPACRRIDFFTTESISLLQSRFLLLQSRFLYYRIVFFTTESVSLLQSRFLHYSVDFLSYSVDSFTRESISFTTESISLPQSRFPLLQSRFLYCRADFFITECLFKPSLSLTVSGPDPADRGRRFGRSHMRPKTQESILRAPKFASHEASIKNQLFGHRAGSQFL